MMKQRRYEMPTALSVLLITGFFVLLIVLIRIGHLSSDARFLNVDLIGIGLSMRGASYEELCEEFRRKIQEKQELLAYGLRNILLEFKGSASFAMLIPESQEQIEKVVAAINASLMGADVVPSDCPDLDIRIVLSESAPEEIASWEAFKKKLNSWCKEGNRLTSIRKHRSRA